MDFPATVVAIRTVRKLFPETAYVLVEDKANGSAIIQTLQHEFPGVIAINPKGGKVARVNAVSPAIESGNVLLPENELWTEEFVDQFTGFPALPHDDMVDACSQALSFLLYSTGGDFGLPPESQEMIEERSRAAQEQEMFLDGSLYDPYGMGGIF